MTAPAAGGDHADLLIVGGDLLTMDDERRIILDGAIAIDCYGAETLGDYAQHGLALLRRDFREGPHDELGRHTAVVCRADEPIELMIDGERRTGEREERFQIHECPVVFLASNRHAAQA